MKDVLVTKSSSLLTKKKILHCYIMSTIMYAAENWVISKADCTRLEAFELCALRKMVIVKWKDIKSGITKDCNNHKDL